MSKIIDIIENNDNLDKAIDKIAPIDMPTVQSEKNTNKNTEQDTEITSNTTKADLAQEKQDVVLENLVENGDFSEGTNNWGVFGGASISASDNILTITGGGTHTYNGARQNITFLEGDIYFLSALARVTNSDCASLLIQSGNASIKKTIINPTINQWYNLSTTGTQNVDEGAIDIRHNYTTATISLNKVEEVDGNYGVFALNLTDIFCKGVTGTGKEPNANLMQKFIEQTGYFNDFHTMTNKEIANAYKEYTDSLLVEKASLNTVPTFDGIKFPSSQVSSSDVNTLDDYEEGTWTPVLSRIPTPATHVYVVQKGSYVKVGKKVTACFSIQTSSSTPEEFGSLRIAGLPFIASFDLPYYMSGDIGYFSLLAQIAGLTLNAGKTEIAILGTTITTSVLFSEWKTTGGYAVGSITYLTN